MNVPRDVIVDLLPVYLSGDASPATRALVEEYLSRDAELAHRVRLQQTQDDASAAPVSLPPEIELRSLQRTRQLLRWQRRLFGFGIGFTILALSSGFSFREHHLSDFHFLMRDYPGVFAPIMALALICWIAYFTIVRRLRLSSHV
ncbi:MAG: anti-sigma factor family protein [Gemmatimonadaceae bacterium]